MRDLPAVLSLLIALAAAMPQRVEAGAWPREQGSLFVSVSQTVSTGARTLISASQDIRNYTSFYGEYGLTGKFTLGVDAGFAGGDQDAASSWLVFARYPLLMTDSGHHVALEFGLGSQDEPEWGQQSRLRPGLSWGKGFESRWGGGWVGLEASADYRIKSKDFGLKADLTAGIRPSERWMLIFQVQSSQYGDDDPIVRVAPSAVRQFGAHTHLQVGFTAPVAGDDAFGIKFGTWAHF
jgi:hypothetical protein